MGPSAFLCLLAIALLAPGRSVATDSGERIARLEAQVEMLTNEVMRMRDRMDTMVCAQPPVTSDPNPGTETSEGTEQGDVGPNISLVLRELRQEETPSGYQISLLYARDESEDVKVIWATYDTMQQLYDGTNNASLRSTLLTDVSKTEPELEETSVLLRRRNATVKVSAFADSIGYGLELDGLFNGSQVITDFDLPQFTIQPQTEVLYQQGHNATVVLTVEKEFEDGLISYGEIVDFGTRNMSFAGITAVGFFNYTVTKRYLDSVELLLQMNTANSPLGGVLHFMFRKEAQAGGLIKNVEVTRTLVLRPSGNSGPFPPGYIQFISLRDTIDNPTSPLCNLEENSCLRTCDLHGEDLRSFQIYKVNGDPSENRPLPEANLFMEWRSKYRWTKMFKALRPTSTSDRNQTYECVAVNTEGRTASQRREVKWYRYVEPEFVDARTGVRVLNSTAFVLTCAVTGEPLPAVSFHIQTIPRTEDNILLGSNPDHTERIGDVLMAYKIVVRGPGSGRLTGASCYLFPDLQLGAMGGGMLVHEYRNLPS